MIKCLINLRGESNIDHGYVLGMRGGQPMDAIFLISVAPIDELDEISLIKYHGCIIDPS